MAASKADAKMNGCIINTVTQITSNPLQVAEKATFSLFQHFGFQSDREICEYVYEGEELPADFVCPLFKHGTEDFEKI